MTKINQELYNKIVKYLTDNGYTNEDNTYGEIGDYDIYIDSNQEIRVGKRNSYDWPEEINQLMQHEIDFIINNFTDDI
jgi:hypothetical protein